MDSATKSGTSILLFGCILLLTFLRFKMYIGWATPALDRCKEAIKAVRERSDQIFEKVSEDTPDPDSENGRIKSLKKSRKTFQTPTQRTVGSNL